MIYPRNPHSAAQTPAFSLNNGRRRRIQVISRSSDDQQNPIHETFYDIDRV